ncbi:MAG: hypothetical protein IPM29_31760 [Planctomycetes bacterium]|nr:hypothetical protein [Planctomycetota bacterium]
MAISGDQHALQHAAGQVVQVPQVRGQVDKRKRGVSFFLPARPRESAESGADGHEGVAAVRRLG